MKKPNYYIDPDELKQSIIEMQELGYPTDRFARHLLAIQEHVLLFPRFCRYHIEVKEEMRMQNIDKWIKYGWKVIDPDKNPFSYITTATYRNFLDGLKKYYNREEKDAVLKKHLIDIAVAENERQHIDTFK